jgi:phenylpropionate dioxygenase-like ring-hydroxylating dioxygenase large terminal subunit
LFPNVLLGVHKDHYFSILLTPDGTGRTNEQIELYYTDPAALTDDYAEMRANNARMWRAVFAEDISVVEGMQKGRNAPAYDGGKFSAVMDESTYHFHKWVARELSA